MFKLCRVHGGKLVPQDDVVTFSHSKDLSKEKGRLAHADFRHFRKTHMQ